MDRRKLFGFMGVVYVYEVVLQCRTLKICKMTFKFVFQHQRALSILISID